MNRLVTKLGKITLKNPVTVASGTFGEEYAEYFDFNLLGAIVTKTITRYAKQGNPSPRLYETEAGLLNSIGLQNPGIDQYISKILPFYRQYNSPLLVSISGSTIEEFGEMVSILETEAGIAGYEVNISCPNVQNEGLAFGIDAQVVYNLTASLAKLTQRELMIKLSPNVTNIVEIALAAESGGASSIALINTLLGMAIDWRTGKTKIAKGLAGYSGIAIKPVALGMVYRVAKAVSLPILAMGGIGSMQDAMEFFYAGASAVAIGTQSFYDPCTAEKVITALADHFDSSQLTLSDVRGKVRGIV